MVRKGGLEPPWVAPPDPKFEAHEESTTYTECDELRPSATDALSSKGFVVADTISHTRSGLRVGTKMGTKKNPLLGF